MLMYLLLVVGRVAKVVKSAGAETWAGTTVLSLSGKEVISAGNETVTVKVYSSVPASVRLKRSTTVRPLLDPSSPCSATSVGTAARSACQ